MTIELMFSTCDWRINGVLCDVNDDWTFLSEPPKTSPRYASGTICLSPVVELYFFVLKPTQSYIHTNIKL